MGIKRSEFYPIEEIVQSVELKLKELQTQNEPLDYLTFVADGEPTLDINLGDAIDRLKPFGSKIAVITNASLIGSPDVRRDLAKADWVSLKIDALSDDVWRKIDRPHGHLNHAEILNGIIRFSEEFCGQLATETMMVKGINDTEEELKKIADFIGRIQPSKAYISIPIRPPAELNIVKPDAESLNIGIQQFLSKGVNAEYLIGYEGDKFSTSGDFDNDFLNITSVHPMRKTAVDDLLKKCDANWDSVENLIEKQKIKRLNYQNETFFVRKF
jgi:wyosine [tRNA(Phe)-imidazoG37] synthetase (radical SAM superfamily)